MKVRTIILTALGFGLALLPMARAEDAKPAAPAAPAPSKPLPAGVGKDLLIDITASVEAINYETREVTLKGPQGNVVTLTADPAIKRLNEIKVHDNVRVIYYASLATELRPPTEEEKKVPLAVLEDAAKADGSAAPAGGAYRVIRAIVTIEGLDRATSMANLKGPRGNYAAVKVKDPAVFASLHIGDSAVVIYTEAVGVKIEKAPAPAAEKKTQ